MSSLLLQFPYRLALPNSKPSLLSSSRLSNARRTHFRPLFTEKRKRPARATICCSEIPPIVLRWICVASTVMLMLTKGPMTEKSHLVSLLAIYAPSGAISWIKGAYGGWTAFLAILIHLFFIRGKLELPLITWLLVRLAPDQAMDFRESAYGPFIATLIAKFLDKEYNSRKGGMNNEGSYVKTMAFICLAAASAVLFI